MSIRWYALTPTGLPVYCHGEPVIFHAPCKLDAIQLIVERWPGRFGLRAMSVCEWEAKREMDAAELASRKRNFEVADRADKMTQTIEEMKTGQRDIYGHATDAETQAALRAMTWKNGEFEDELKGDLSERWIEAGKHYRPPTVTPHKPREVVIDPDQFTLCADPAMWRAVA